MGSIEKTTLAELDVGQPLIEGNGRIWVRVGWDSVSRYEGSVPPQLLERMGLIPICDMGGNVRFGPGSLVVTGLKGEPVEDRTLLGLWQYAVN